MGRDGEEGTALQQLTGVPRQVNLHALCTGAFVRNPYLGAFNRELRLTDAEMDLFAAPLECWTS